MCNVGAFDFFCIFEFIFSYFSIFQYFCNSMFVFLCCSFQISCENKFMGFIDSGMVVVLIITVVLLIVTALLLFYNFEVGILLLVFSDALASLVSMLESR